MKIKKIIDISRRISPAMAVWPGDAGVEIFRESSIKDGSYCNLSSISLGLHTGTHIDAPLHFIDTGKDISMLDLSRFIGFVKVFDMEDQDKITFKTIKHLPIEKDDMIFFKTRNSLISQEDKFKKSFVSLDLSAVTYLIEKNVRTLGIDYLSVESYYSRHHDVHKMLLSNNIGVIEGLYLKEASAGTYFFSCLPLYIECADGSPVRAVLIEFSET